MTEDLHHLSAAYALDALDPDERAAFEAHYPSCDICVSDVQLGREVAAALAAESATEAPAGLKASVMGEVTRTRQISPRVPDRVVDITTAASAAGRRARWLAGAAAAVVLLVGVVALTRSNNSSALDDVLAAPDALVTALEGADGSLRVVWSPERDQVALFASDLTSPGPGLVYALWSLGADGSAAPAGLFGPDDEGTVRVVLDVDDVATAGWGITIEPETGSPQPTTDVIYIGEV